MRSDRRPTGYCVSTAAKMLTAMKAATPRGAETRQPRIDRPHGEDDGRDHSGEGHRHHPERRVAVKITETHPLRRDRPGGFLGRGDDRHHCRRDQGGNQHETFGRLRPGEHQQELRAPQSHVQDQHVDGEQLSAIGARGPVVEPALRHHVDAREADTGQEAHQCPGCWRYPGAMRQHGHRGEGGQGGEHPHRTDPGQQPGGKSACRAGTPRSNTT